MISVSQCWVIFLLPLVLTTTGAQQVTTVEMTALSALHNATNGDNWRWQNEQEAGAVWNFTLDGAGHFVNNPCSSSVAINQTWQGVSCSQSPHLCSFHTCHIIKIDLVSYGLSGFIPSDIDNFSFLQLLRLDDNQLTGHIPREVGSLSALTHFSLWVNLLSGTIPAEIGQLQSLTYLDFDSNSLTGTLPSTLANLTNLLSLYIGETSVTGSIPSEFGELTVLEILYLYSNQLTGTIPIELSQLLVLRIFNLSINQLTGTIPHEVGQLDALRLMSLHSNQLTGSIPEELGTLTTLEILYIHNNLLTGTIISEVGQLTFLEQFYLHTNQLTGTIPSEVGQLRRLEVLSIRSNQLTGTIPNEVGELTALEQLLLYSNQLTGIIPDTINLLDIVDELWLHDNLLSGKLPTEISTMKRLRSLFLQNNLLTGHLDGVFNHLTQLELTNVDMSNNMFSGSLSTQMFRLPQLKVLALSVNCFEEELPSSVCSARQVEVLSLNGLRAAEGCTDSVEFPLSGVGLFNTIGGTVPACVWALRNLSVLHLTGNGLTGELVRSLPMISQMADLSLSHNQLSGTIPLDILNIASLDLSYNQLRGVYDDRTQHAPGTSVSLEINRLSGQLPVSGLERVSNGSVSILRGNLFACNSIPRNDEFSRDYVCGSRILNDSLFVFVSAFGIAVLVVLLVCWARFVGGERCRHLLVATLHSRCVLLWTYLLYMMNLDIHGLNLNSTYASAVHLIAKLSGSLVEVMHYAVQLLIVILLGSVPLYITKAMDSSDEYVTHSKTYAWFWTLAYMRGVVPACLLLVLWTGAISACFYRVIVCLLPMRRKGKTLSESAHEQMAPATAAAAAADTKTDSFMHRGVPIGSAFVFNACITITVNTLYIYSTQQALGAILQFCIQLSLSVFRLLYVAIALPLLSRPIRNSVANIRFRFILLTINNLLIPCVVTALTSDACFQGLLIPAHAVSTPYSYNTCVLRTTVASGETYCSEYSTIEVESASLVPPFTYNNQCGSVVLTSYIPVFLLGFSIQLLLPFIVLVSLTYLTYDSLSPSVRMMLHGILWPEHWLQNSEDTSALNKTLLHGDPSILLKIRTIFCNDVFNNWLLMVTFGLCSPVLVVAIVCSVLLKMSLWVSLIGRFTRCHLHDDRGVHDGGRQTEVTTVTASSRSSVITSSACAAADKDRNDAHVVYDALVALAAVHIPLHDVLIGSFWRLVWCSAIFVALLGWDMAMDEVGWLQSVWVPLIPLCYVVLLRCATYFLYSHSNYSSDSVEKTVFNGEIEVSGVSQSPLHVDRL